ncbi:hypothetical protein BKA82DRAFT_4079946 [Pisolithus tinctorius]|nr:hypothetical protein BKA82DRAFT_4079946 [Pisolithus tinctorius]
MRLPTLLARGLCLAATLVSFIAVANADSEEPEVSVVATFPESNPFSQVVNGERNQIFLAIENKSDRNVTLQSIGGSFHHPETGTLVKNTTSLAYGVPLLEGAKLQIPYAFHSEFKTGDLRLTIWLDHITEGEKYRVIAYDSIVTIVEPEVSWFDFKLISTYLIVAAILGGGSYYAYLTYLPVPKVKNPKRRQEGTTPAATATGTSTGGYDEDWIPVHHLKKPKAKKVAVGSGEEPSAGETSGTEGRKRKTRK